MSSSKKTHRPLTLAALLLSLFMAALEMTVVSTAMPTVVGDLGGIQLYSWVFTAYLLTSTVTVPIFGKLADLYGRKPVLLIGSAVFLLGSGLSGLAQTMLQLVLFRAFQGIGAGAMQPVVITVIGDMYTLEERAKVQGFTGAVWGFAGLIGPLLGGWIVHFLSWHWIFFLNIPFGIVSIALVWLFLHEDVEKKPHQLDFVGAGLLTGGVLCLLFGASGAGMGLWPFAAAAIFLALFAVVERKVREPVLPLGLFSEKVIALSSVAGTLLGGTMLAAVTYVPLFVQAILGGSATDAGSAITPMVIGWPIASTIGGRLVPKVGFHPLIRIGLALMAVGGIGTAILLAPGVNLHLIQLLMFVMGAGMGFANTALLLAVQTSVDWKQRGVATASTMFFRTIGGALAVGALGGIVTATLAADPSIPAGAAGQLVGPEHGAGLDPELLRTLSAALASALRVNFWAIAGLATLAFAVGLFFPRTKREKLGALEGAQLHVGE
ncbi:MDR family MFS transporter [Vulgatibacter incomptus]|uniref:Drug resistance transporter, EmrB/QacA family n=1 Tax=Vulgatibacter incomptus TaxID=1391653 RepID=A0A0K1PJK2_9BACT|nr:MDR family MFS transporter [Vulgatibacter incomptus]AKU93279.1 drug resistance transporter, EmrB/QacA family [Vulgatibacter incomptus]